MGINSRYGVSSSGGGVTPSKWKSFTFFEGNGSITEGDGQQSLLTGDVPSATDGNLFIINIAIFGDSANTVVTPNLVFSLIVNGSPISTDNLSAPSIDTETWYRGFVEKAPASTGLIELLWEYTSGTPGAQMNVARVTMQVQEVAP